MTIAIDSDDVEIFWYDSLAQAFKVSKQASIAQQLIPSNQYYILHADIFRHVYQEQGRLIWWKARAHIGN